MIKNTILVKVENKLVNHNIALETKKMIIASAIMGFSGILSETSMNVAFPILVRIFDTSLGKITWLATAYLLCVAITITLSSYLKQRFESRMIFLFTCTFFFIGTFIGSVATSFDLLLVARVMQGISTGLSIPLTFNLVIYYIPAQKLGQWMGFSSMIMSLAPSIGPTFGGLLVDIVGWRMIFITILPIPVISFLIGFSAFKKNEKPNRQNNFDFLAFALLTIALTVLLIFISKIEAQIFDGKMLLLFLITFTCFVVRSLSSKKIFLNIKILTNIDFLTAVIPFAIYQFINIGGNFIIPSYLQLGFGVSSLLAGLSLFPGTVAAVLLNPIFGKIYDRHGEKQLILLGNLLTFISLIMMLFTTNTMGFLGLLTIYMLFSLGRVMAFSILNVSALKKLKNNQKTDGTAILQTAQQFSGAIGTSIVSLITVSSPNIKVGMHNSLMLFIIMIVFIFIILVIRYGENFCSCE